jgi:alpha/beta superfamily hydrolase
MVTETAEMLTTTDGVTLEAGVGVPPTPRGGMVVCHPHPLYGGDMDNPVVVRIVEVARSLDMASLRFNFRGVGRSTGAHGHGAAERHDVEAALSRITALLATDRGIALAGYSFGAAMVGSVAPRHATLAGVALIAPPLARVEPQHWTSLSAFGPRVLIVAGTDDELCPEDALSKLSQILPEASVHRIEGANHFFFGKLYPLGEALAAWLRGVVLKA